jgi:hypothetical protein
MHTYNEVVSIEDAVSLTLAVSEFVCSEKLASIYSREEDMI